MKRFLLFLCLAASFCTLHAENYNYLTAVTSELEQSFALNTLKTITFTSTDIVFTQTDGTQTTLPLATLSQLNFTQEATAIKSVESNVNADHQQAVVYSSDGKVLSHQSLNNIKEVNLSSMPHGIYIVKKGNETLKLIR